MGYLIFTQYTNTYEYNTPVLEISLALSKRTLRSLESPNVKELSYGAKSLPEFCCMAKMRQSAKSAR